MKVQFKTSNEFIIETDEAVQTASFRFDILSLNLDCTVTENGHSRTFAFRRTSNRFLALSAKYDIYEGQHCIAKLAFKWNGAGMLDFQGHHDSPLIVAKSFSGRHVTVSNAQKQRILQVDKLADLFSQDSIHAVTVSQTQTEQSLTDLLLFTVLTNYLRDASDDR